MYKKNLRGLTEHTEVLTVLQMPQTSLTSDPRDASLLPAPEAVVFFSSFRLVSPAGEQTKEQ